METSSTSEKRLQYVRRVLVEAMEDEFIITKEVLHDRFNIGRISSDFQRLFFGKTQKIVPAMPVALHKLDDYLTSQEIRDELGEHAVLPLTCMFSLLGKQRSGKEANEERVLSMNGCTELNLIIIEVEEKVEERGQKVTKKTLWAVFFYWNSFYRDWHVGASSVESPGRWGHGSQFLSSGC